MKIGKGTLYIEDKESGRNVLRGFRNVLCFIKRVLLQYICRK